jgi:putative PIN family toxin of toxin-antitoxin system
MGSKEKIVLKMNDGKIRVLLDTNIYISALGWSGKPKIIFEKCLSGEFELITSAEQLDELIRVMDYSKFKFTLDQKQNMLGIISSIAIFVEIPRKLKVIEDDPDDDVILETAVVGNVDFLITGDPHLLKIKEFAKIKIVTANEFLII